MRLGPAPLLLAACSVALVLTACSGASDGARPSSVAPSLSDTTTSDPSVPAGTAAGTPIDDSVVYGPESVRVMSMRGGHPLRLRLLGPPGASFRLRHHGQVAPCTVTGEVGDQAPPSGMPSNVTTRYAVECHSASPQRAVLLPTVGVGAFTYEFEVPIGRE